MPGASTRPSRLSSHVLYNMQSGASVPNSASTNATADRSMIADAATAKIALSIAAAIACPSNLKGAIRMRDSAPTLVVFGFDPEGSPRAGRFIEPDAEIAVKAAVLLGYEAIRVSDAEILEVLPDGNVFAHGDGFIRRINR